MLIAKESGDPSQIILAIKQILTNCIVDVDIETLAVFDIEYMLMMIRGRSVNNVVEFAITDPDTDEQVKLSMDIDRVTIHRPEGHSNQIRINDAYVMFMKYPNYNMYVTALQPDSDPMAYYQVMLSCIDKICSDDETYTFSDLPPEEVDSFVDGLQSEVIESVQRFFETMPIVRHVFEYTNKNGVDKTFIVEGTTSFFI